MDTKACQGQWQSWAYTHCIIRVQNRLAYHVHCELCGHIWLSLRHACCCLLLKELWGTTVMTQETTQQVDFWGRSWYSLTASFATTYFGACKLSRDAFSGSLHPNNCIIIVSAKLYNCSANVCPEASSARYHNRSVLAWNECGQCKRSIRVYQYHYC